MDFIEIILDNLQLGAILVVILFLAIFISPGDDFNSTNQIVVLKIVEDCQKQINSDLKCIVDEFNFLEEKVSDIYDNQKFEVAIISENQEIKEFISNDENTLDNSYVKNRKINSCKNFKEECVSIYYTTSTGEKYEILLV